MDFAIMQSPRKSEQKKNHILKGFEFAETDVVGQGNFADVFLGKETATKKPVAIKRVIKKKIIKNPKLVAGMKTEVNIMSRGDLDHTHV